MSTAQPTAKPWRVTEAWTEGKNGSPKRCGWHLLNGDEWAQTFPTKREAQSHADKFNSALIAKNAADSQRRAKMLIPLPAGTIERAISLIEHAYGKDGETIHELRVAIAKSQGATK